MDKHFLYRVRRALAHIQHGTALRRLHLEWQKHEKKRRSKWWNSQVGKRDYFDAKMDLGLRIRLHFDSELARVVYCDDFERTERLFLDAFLKPGDIFVDVGANIGLFSLIAALRVGYLGKVYAFEPAKVTYERLQKNVVLNGFRNVQCLHSALSDKPGQFPFYVSEEGFDAWNSFARPIAGTSFSKELIECLTWDRFARLHHLVGKVAMMKIDVEGWETRVLEGARETFSRDDAPLLQVEFTEAASTSAGSSCESLYRLLENLGYRMFGYDSSRRELIHDPLRESYPYVNLIAAKTPEEANSRLRTGAFR
jgi:FkbM family methyltransferase